MIFKHCIYGAGGHGKVVLDAMQTKKTDCFGFVDDKSMSSWAGLKVYPLTQLDGSFSLHLAIGSCTLRERLAENLTGVEFFNVSHANAVISSSANINEGVFIAANAIIGPSANIGKHSIVNHAAVVDHDCVVGDYSHIAPQCTLGGGVKIGKGVLIGAGATVLPGLEIANYAIVGAGAIVTKNVGSGTTVVGTPAKIFNN